MSGSFVRRGVLAAWGRLLLAMVLAVCGMFPVLQTERAFAANETKYADIRGHAVEPLLSEWIAEALLQGYADGAVRPDQPITRAEFMALINRSFGLHGPADIAVSDVTPGDWRYEQAAVAVQTGYVNGYPDGTIRPDRHVAQQEAAVMVARLLQSDIGGDIPNRDLTLPDWSRDAVLSLAAAGVLEADAIGAVVEDAAVTRADAVVLLDRALKRRTVVFAEAGVYGPESGSAVIRGNVLLDAAGITLRNTTVTGNLTIGEGVGEGDAVLDHVLVRGDTIVNGGGGNSIYFKDSVLVKIVVDKKNGEVRIVAEGKTNVQQVNVQSGAKIDNSKATDGGFANVSLADRLPGGSKVQLLGSFDSVDVSAKDVSIDVPDGSIKSLNVSGSAEGTQLNLGKNAKVADLLLKAPLNVTGQGQIEKATIEKGAENSTFQTKPVSQIAGPGVTLPDPPVSTPDPSDTSGGSDDNDDSGSNDEGGSDNPGGSDDDDDDNPAPEEAELESAAAADGMIVAQMNRTPPDGLTAADFTVMQRINGGEAVQVTPTAVTANPATREVKLTVPAVPQTLEKQTVTYTVTYRSVTVTTNAFEIEPLALTVTGLVYEEEVTIYDSDVQLSLQALMIDSSPIDVTDAAVWSSSDESVATVTESGLLHAAAASGQTTVTAEYAGFTAIFNVTIAEAINVTSVTSSLKSTLSLTDKYELNTGEEETVFIIPADDAYEYLIIRSEQQMQGVEGAQAAGIPGAQVVRLLSRYEIVVKHDEIPAGLYTLEITGLQKFGTSVPMYVKIKLKKLSPE
jgi:hypothetical protein